MTNEVVSLATTKSDADRAAELRQRIETAVRPVLALLDEAAQSGLQINFRLGRDQFGRNVLQDLSIVRPL